MEQMERLEFLHLHIQAAGDPLWNPLWLWHYTSQSFKVSETKAFSRITFDLEECKIGVPNHLERNENGKWDWRCASNHFVQDDEVGRQPIRHFCASLYALCTICDLRSREDKSSED